MCISFIIRESERFGSHLIFLDCILCCSPLAKFEKIGIFGDKKDRPELSLHVKYIKIHFHNFSDFLERAETSLRVPKEA